jgi:UDP-N-acetylglucosamine acyltransferase
MHPTALIDPRAVLADDVEVGPWAQIGPGAVIGSGSRVGAGAVVEAGVVLADRVEVGHHSVIHSGVRLGEGCQLFAHVVLGAAPQDRKFAGEASRLEVGPRTVFREFSTAHRGTGAGGLTRVGAGCLFMIGSHVAHDCVVEDNVVMANHVALAGHVHVGAGAVLGGLCAVHQHCRVGRLAMIGGGAMVAADVPPFSLAQGDRARLLGLNQVGLQRAGLTADPQVYRELKQAYRLAYRSGESLSDVVEKLSQGEHNDLVRYFSEFLRAAQQPDRRGLTPGRRRASRSDDE